MLANADRVFTPGLFARVQLEGARESTALLIDDKAVLTDQDRKYVYVLGPDNTARAQGRRARPHGRWPARGACRDLTAEDQVIVDGVQKVFMPGMPVAPADGRDGRAAAKRKPAPVASAE